MMDEPARWLVGYIKEHENVTHRELLAEATKTLKKADRTIRGYLTRSDGDRIKKIREGREVRFESIEYWRRQEHRTFDLRVPHTEKLKVVLDMFRNQVPALDELSLRTALQAEYRPDMQLEFGPGGNLPTDVFIRRCGPRCLDASATITADAFIVRTPARLNDDVVPLSAAEAADAVQQLNPVTYVSRDAQNDRRVGFIDENLPNALGASVGEGMSPMELLALLTKVVQQQQTRIDALERQLIAPASR